MIGSNLKKFLNIFRFGYRAYVPFFAEQKYRYLDHRNQLLQGPCSVLTEDLGLGRGLFCLIATGTGLLLVREGRLEKVFDSMGNIFGLTLLAGRIYINHVIHAEGNYKNTEESYRRSEIYSVSVEQLANLAPGEHLEVRRELSETGVLYAYCNSHNGKLYSVDYLGQLSVFEVDQEGRIDHAGARSCMINRHLDGSPLHHYAYTHINCVSVTSDKVILGAHGRKAHTGQFSKIYTIDLDLDPASIRYTSTPYVHAHDVLIAGGDFYACDSRNRALIRNGEKLFVDSTGFLRGLSVLEDGYLVGHSIRSTRRSERNRESAFHNQIVRLDRKGKLVARATLTSSQVYNLLVLSETDFTVSSTAEDNCPDIAGLLSGSESCDVATYYGGETPESHQTKANYY